MTTSTHEGSSPPPQERRPLPPQRDLDELRRLGERLADISAPPVQREKADAWRKLNTLKDTRPLVFICQIPWTELEQCDELVLHTSHPLSRQIEKDVRRTLYAWSHFPADMVVSGVIPSPLVIRDSGFGIVQRGRSHTFYSGSIHAQCFEPQIRDEKDLDKIRMPMVELDEEATEEEFHFRMTIFENVLPVEKLGAPGFWFAPWDELVRWYGVQEALTDLVLRPELVHQAMERLVSAYLCRLDQYETLGLLAPNHNGPRVSSGGPGFTDELPHDMERHQAICAANLWGCAAAQILSGVSPEMHEEFALRHERRWLERFGLNYYGCCEPLHHKIPVLRTIPRLRKVSISPKASVSEAVHHGAGRDFVLSLKPNPAILAESTWDLEQARRELRKSLDEARGCKVEVILKDISTIRFEPHRLDEWARMAMEETAQWP